MERNKKKDKSKKESDRIEDNCYFELEYENLIKETYCSEKSTTPVEKLEDLKGGKKDDKEDCDREKEELFIKLCTTNREPKLEGKIDDENEVNKDDEKADDDEYIIIDGKRFLEIQIEGCFLMDGDRNIYNKKGKYIGTAKDDEVSEELISSIAHLKAKEKVLVDPATAKQELKLEAKKDDKKKINKGDEKTDDDEYQIIDGKRFREIQIEGEEEEFLMDDDGNIYDKEGQYIGTVKDGEGEDTEEEK
jgi:sporulation protein YlmC with PRC-barrel domain